MHQTTPQDSVKHFIYGSFLHMYVETFPRSFPAGVTGLLGNVARSLLRDMVLRFMGSYKSNCSLTVKIRTVNVLTLKSSSTTNTELGDL